MPWQHLWQYIFLSIVKRHPNNTDNYARFHVLYLCLPLSTDVSRTYNFLSSGPIDNASVNKMACIFCCRGKKSTARGEAYRPSNVASTSQGSSASAPQCMLLLFVYFYTETGVLIVPFVCKHDSFNF